MKAAAVLMEVLRSAGVRYLFGNPGTTELTFLDALPDSGLEYVVALQETVAVSAADGYAQAPGRVGVVNVHVAPGVGNSLSILHNASRARSPLVVNRGATRFAAPPRRADPVRRPRADDRAVHEVVVRDATFSRPASRTRGRRSSTSPSTGASRR